MAKQGIFGELIHQSILTKRGFAFFIDLNAITIIGLVLFNLFPSSSNLIFLFLIPLVLLKDLLFKCGSIGKKLCGLKIIDNKQPFVSQRILRNIPLFIWPIEAVLILANRKRIGDLIAKTDVIIS